jgi:ribosomal protein L21
MAKDTTQTGPFAVIATGGKQYVVRTGDIITVEKMDGQYAAGDIVNSDQTLSGG